MESIEMNGAAVVVLERCPMCDASLPRDIIEMHVNTHFETTPRQEEDAAAAVPRPRQSAEPFAITERVTDHIQRLVASKPLRINPVVDFVVASNPAVSHFAMLTTDRGCCGWKNIQMLLSALVRVEPYRSRLGARLPGGMGNVPKIFELQAALDDAWARGHDPEGARQLGNSVLGTRRWIGATECAALLRSLSLRVEITDFDDHDKDETTSAADRFIAWTWRHFIAARAAGGVVLPMYFQQQGHSRTIVGAERRRNGEIVLLMLDPSMSRAEVQRALFIDKDPRSFRRTPRSFKCSQYQVASVTGVLPDHH